MTLISSTGVALDEAWFDERRTKFSKLLSAGRYTDAVSFCKSGIAELDALTDPKNVEALGMKASFLSEMSMAFMMLNKSKKALSAELAAHRIVLKLPYFNLNVYHSLSILGRKYAAVGDMEGARRCAVSSIASLTKRYYGSLICELIDEIAELDACAGDEGAAVALRRLAAELRIASRRIYIPSAAFRPFIHGEADQDAESL